MGKVSFSIELWLSQFIEKGLSYFSAVFVSVFRKREMVSVLLGPIESCALIINYLFPQHIYPRFYLVANVVNIFDHCVLR
jgi:hypothetical protein